MTTQQKLKQYALLVRLPNTFTSITNVAVGYFSVIGVSNSNALDLVLLSASSALLYTSGIVFNDYFDLKVDLAERPSRPLPSGKISIKSALVLAIGALVAANAMALMVGLTSLIISLALSGIILAYDNKAKQTVFGPLTMGSARFFNVLLGASAGFNGYLAHPGTVPKDGFPVDTLFPAMLMLSYVYSITLLSRKEAMSSNETISETSVSRRTTFSIITLTVLALIGFFLLIGRPLALVTTSILVFVVWHAWQGSKPSSSGGLVGNKRIQKAVKALVLSIIVIDSAFVTAYAGMYFGIAVLSILGLPIILSKKLYVT